MRASGFIVRFVDVVLLLLFGFITISNLQDTDVPLPESTETDPVPVDVEEVIFVGVLDDGRFLVEDETKVLNSIESLREYLQQTRRRLGPVPLKVRIRASRTAPVRYAFAVAALCDELGVNKSLEVELDAPNQ